MTTATMEAIARTLGEQDLVDPGAQRRMAILLLCLLAHRTAVAVTTLLTADLPEVAVAEAAEEEVAAGETRTVTLAVSTLLCSLSYPTSSSTTS